MNTALNVRIVMQHAGEIVHSDEDDGKWPPCYLGSVANGDHSAYLVNAQAACLIYEDHSDLGESGTFDHSLHQLLGEFSVIDPIVERAEDC